MTFDVFERVDEIAHVLSPDRWMLVGGLMVHAHARLAGIPHPRPTDDADLVVELRAGNYSEAASALQGLGYQRHECRWTIGLRSTGSRAAASRWT